MIDGGGPTCKSTAYGASLYSNVTNTYATLCLGNCDVAFT